MTNGKISRRAVTRQLGMAAGATMLAPGLANAADPTPGQIEGPFHPIEPQSDTDLDLTMIEGHTNAATGDVIVVRGRVLDTEGQPLPDTLVDVWQANHFGRYWHPDDPNPADLDPDFQGWGLIRTDASGGYSFKTIRPGPYSLEFLGQEGWRARHIHFKVSRAGLRLLTTQMYFKGDPLLEQDEQIVKAPEALRHLLITDAETQATSGLPLHRFDILLAASA